MTAPRQPLTMTPAEVARALGIAKSTVNKYASRDGHVCGVPAIRVGRTVRFSRAAILAVASGRRAA